MTGREGKGEDDTSREDLREMAAERIRDLPAETALGGSDQAAMADRAGREAPDADLENEATGRVEGIADLEGTGTRAPLGDQSTGGEAARQAIGAEPHLGPQAEQRIDETADWGRFEQIGPLLRYGPGPAEGPELTLPRVGEHTTEVLTELGLSHWEIDALLAAKVARRLDEEHP